jgi:hypothetical protein
LFSRPSDNDQFVNQITKTLHQDEFAQGPLVFRLAFRKHVTIARAVESVHDVALLVENKAAVAVHFFPPGLFHQVAAPQDGYPRSEATGDGQRLPLAKQDARGAGIGRAAAGDRSSDASGGIALDRTDDPERRVRSPEEGKEEEGEWTL